MGDGLRTVEADDLPPPPPEVCADGAELPGIDVSKWNGDIDWPTVAGAGIKYAFVRVSDGTTHFDPRFDENWSESRAAGIHTGVYQFFRPNQDVIAQADLLLQHMGELGPDDLPPVIDVEANGNMSSSAVAAAVGQWIDHVEAATGVQPIVYTGRYFWQDNVGSSQWNDYPLWIAHYTSGCPNLPSQWSDWVFHQYTETGSVAGISGNVDLNDFNGDLAALQAYMVAPGVCGDATCSGGENADLCPEDCSPCGSIASAGETLIDNGDPCYELYGDAQYWRDSNEGIGGSSVWTNTTTSSEFNYAIWRLHFQQGGIYTVEAHVPPGASAVSAATYDVLDVSGTQSVVVDQVAASGWVALGAFEFDQGGFGQHVKLSDHQGASGQKLVFDAIRVISGDVTEPSTPGDPGAPGDDDDDGGAGGSGGDDDGGHPDDPSADGDTDDDDSVPWGGRRNEPQGCSVRGSGSPMWALLLFPLLATRRRRE